MKICFIIQGLKKGGAERVVSLLSNNFDTRGMEVIIALTETVDNIAYPLNKSIKIVDLASEIKNSNLIVKRYSLIKKLRKLFIEESPDVCVSFITRTNIYSIIAGLKLDVPLIVSERNNPLVDPKSKVTRILRNFVYPYADGFVFQTDFSQSCFPEKIRKKSLVIPNPVTDEVYLKPKNIEKRKEIIAVCRLEEQKNLPMLIKAFSNISESASKYSLVIYGEGRMRKSLEQLIESLSLEDNVHLMGQRDDVIQLMHNAEIFVLSSNYEGMPNALAEAMSVGLACISTDCSAYGSRFLIKHNTNGLLIPVGDQKALESALYTLLNDSELRNTIAENAKSTREILATDKISDTWIEYIESILKNKK